MEVSWLHGWLARVGLGRPELRAWSMYDWANSVFMTTGILIFPMYFADVVAADLEPAEATQRHALATTIALAITAALAPILGALADAAGLKKRFLGIFLGIGVTATAGLAGVGSGDWLLAATLFGLANVGVAGSLVFYESLLPHIAKHEEIDRVATAGYALGYLGGALPMALNILWLRWPERFGFSGPEMAFRASFLFAAVWWAVFSIPLFRTVPEPPRGAGDGKVRLGTAVRRLAETFHELRGYKHAAIFLVAFVIYNDGIVTIIRMASIYGLEIGIDFGTLALALLLVQFVGIPFSFLFGAIADRIGPKQAIYIGLAVYTVIAIVGYRMTSAADFFTLAILVGTVQGGSQALSRSLFATMIPKQKSAEFFGFFGVFEKFAGIFGPFLFAGMISLTGSSRPAILGIIAFFVVGGALLAFVDVAEGRRAARAAEAQIQGA